MWNEAFAEYSDSLFRRSLDKDSDGTQGIPPFRRVNDAFDQLPVAAAFDTNDKVHASVGYDKGSEVMRALEGEIGLESVLKSMRTFLEEHPAGEIADWPEFEATVNKVTGKDLRWFFHQWLEQTGLPSAQLRNLHVLSNNGKTVLEADVVQTGTPYRMTLECAIRLATGTKIVPLQVRAEQVTHISVALDSKPSSVRLNPRGIVPLVAPANSPPGEDAATYPVK
jgi:aminopeptidase N